jgi:hypothetical protein
MATRAQLETVLVARVGRLLESHPVALTASANADASPRAYLGDPIARALRSMGYPTANPSAPADAEVQAVPASAFDELADRATLAAVDTAILRWTEPDQASDAERQDWGKLRDSFAARRDALAAGLPGAGAGLAGGLRGGTIGLGVLARPASEDA